MTDLSQLVGLKEAAELVGCEVKTIRRAAKKGKVPGAIKVLGRWGFVPEELDGWEVPEVRSSPRGPSREDGRVRYKIYLTGEEAAKLGEAGFQLVNLAELARARRVERQAAKKAAQAEEVEPEEDESLEAEIGEDTDPFEAFEV